MHGGHPAPQLDPQVLGPDEGGVTPHGWPPEQPEKEDGDGARDHPTGDGHDPPGERGGPVVFMGGQDHGPAPRHHAPDQIVENVPVLGVETGVGLVEQPELGIAGHEGGQRGPPALPGGQRAHRRGCQPALEPQAGQRRPHPRHRGPGGTHGEADVLGRGQVVIKSGGMTEQPDPPADRSRVGDQVGAENGGLAR